MSDFENPEEVHGEQDHSGYEYDLNRCRHFWELELDDFDEPTGHRYCVKCGEFE